MKEKSIIGTLIAFTLATTIAGSVATIPLLALQPQSIEAATNRVGGDLTYSGPRASLAVSGKNIYLTWWDNKTGNNEVFFAGSSNGGKSFRNPINLSNATGGSADSQIAASDSNVYVTWWDNKTGSCEVFFARSTDNGKTFGNATNVSNSTDLSSIGARIAASGSNVYIAWIDITNAGQKQVMFRASDDDGKTFGKPIMLNTTTTAASVRGG